MARFFIDRPIFAWVIAIVVMLAGALIASIAFARRLVRHTAPQEAYHALADENAQTLSTAEDCRLGRWLTGEGRERFGHLAAFNALAAPQQAIHQGASQAVAALGSLAAELGRPLLDRASGPARAR